MLKIAVLISGNGTNLQSIIDNIEKGILKCSIEAVISDRECAFGLKRAETRGIRTYCPDRKDFGDNLSNEILKLLDSKVDLIVLAGFLSVLKGEILNKFENRIINIHPSLLPSFCGEGMYGIKVHEKVLDYGVKISGCTVHFVDAGTDTGPILLQRTVEVYEADTPQKLAERILEKEHEALTEAIGYISEGRVRINGRRVMIEPIDNL